MRLLFFIGLFFFLASANGQVLVEISGKVMDAGDKSALVGAVVFCKNNPAQGATTDVNGNFKLKINNLECGVLVVRYLGYADKEVEISSNKKTLSILMQQTAQDIEEIVITETRSDDNVKKAEMGRVELKSETIKSLPVIFGETDVLKTITLLPGIKSGGEGNTGFYVRGGGPDQNLVTLDGAVVYNANHLLGFFSVFNGDIVDKVEVIKGGMPANHGGRLSSIVSVKMRDGDFDKLKVNGGIGLISSRLSIEGPIQQGRSSFVVSGRRTYADILAKPFIADSLRENSLYFYDLNAKASFVLSTKDKVAITLYNGRDAFRYINPRNQSFRFGINWGNRLANINWSHQFKNNFSQSISAGMNEFNLKTDAEFTGGNLTIFSGLRDFTLQADYTLKTAKNHNIQWGGKYIYHTFVPGILTAQQSGNNFNVDINNQYAHEGALYINDEFDLSSRIAINAGLRYSVFNQVGPYTQELYDEFGTPTGEAIKYSRGSSIALWDGFEPRLSARYTLTESSSLKGSYTRTNQYLHLATSSSATLPSDLWVPSSRLVRPQIADQVSVGYFKNFKQNMWEASVEGYYKTMQNQIEFRPGAQLFFNQNLENEMIFGSGEAYGIEFLLRKNIGKLNGWIGYTLSRTTRTFDALNEGKPYLYRYDRPHDISVVINYKFNKHWNASFVFVYGSGQMITLPTGRYAYFVGVDKQEGVPLFSILDYYTKINTFRMPAYHRADISATYTPRPEARFHSSWNFSIYNIYNRANPYFIYFDANRKTGQINAYMVYLFPIIPSVTWNFKF